ncbi:MAG: hypothetical protein JWQ63_257 [Mucilaginibacter sp.]|nr:hypothetical protein [Mucilaginibacter sp.]
MKKCWLFLLLLAAFRWSGFGQEIHFTKVDPPKDDPWTGITGITQDSQGYLWLAAFNGLYKYDGNNYTFYRSEAYNPNSLGTNQLEHIFANKDGIIRVATFGAGLDRLDPLTGKFTNFRHRTNEPGSLADNKVSCIIGAYNGIVGRNQEYGKSIHVNSVEGKESESIIQLST